MLILAGLALLTGLAGALVLLGVLGPGLLPGGIGQRVAAGHGLLMVLGFLGTLIALERAAALGRSWGYGAPIGAGLGGLALLVGTPIELAGLLFAAGGAGLLGIYLAVDRIERSLQTTIQGLGAMAWLVAAIALLAGRGIPAVIAPLAAFLVLTIAGERLDLARLGGIGGRPRVVLGASVALVALGTIGSFLDPDGAVRLTGVGLLGLAAWLARFDIARRTVRLGGATRFIAVALLLGYGWLAVAGLLWVATGAVVAGLAYDALLHALFLGFVVSMVFAHAPIILPAVTGLPLPYRPWFVGHLALLHVGLLLRVGIGDLGGSIHAWQTGGVLNVLALLLFVVASAAAAVDERRRRTRRLAVPHGPVGPTERDP